MNKNSNFFAVSSNHKWAENHAKLWMFIAIIGFSLLLRVVTYNPFAAYWFPDEERYEDSVGAVWYWNKHINEGVSTANYIGLEQVITYDHMLFKVIGVIPAVIGWFMPYELEYAADDAGAMFFSLIAVANIALLFFIVCKLGDIKTALLSAFVFSLSVTNYYYGKHLLPYDLGMFFGLLGILIGLHSYKKHWSVFLCGVCASCCILSYNGYWILAGLCLIAATFYTLFFEWSYVIFIYRSAIGLAGLILPVIAVIQFGHFFDRDFIAQYVRFSNTVTLGEFSEGWSLPFSYYWSAENGLFLLWMIACGYLGIRILKKEVSVLEIFLAISVCYIYGALVISSVFLEKFVVYGRLVRQLTPFLCAILAAGFYYFLYEKTNKKIYFSVFIALISVIGMRNINEVNNLTFPAEFIVNAHTDISAEHYVIVDYINMGYARNTIRVGEHLAPAKLIRQPPEIDQTYRYHIVNSNFIFFVPREIDTSKCTLIRTAPNPINYKPFLFEGNTAEERLAIEQAQVQMQLWDCHQ